jgi:hypothetical protein
VPKSASHVFLVYVAWWYHLNINFVLPPLYFNYYILLLVFLLWVTVVFKVHVLVTSAALLWESYKEQEPPLCFLVVKLFKV